LTRLFIDTSGWANLFFHTEPYHSKSSVLIRHMVSTRDFVLTSNYVLAEFSALLMRPLRVPSLVDCSSFVLMKKHGLTEVLTEDRHFEQAGFMRLLGR
jgi:predicted nucleic acid-binding protein